MNKIIPLTLLAGGIVLIILGVNANDTFHHDIARFFASRSNNKAVWMVIGGIAAAVIGALSLGNWKSQKTKYSKIVSVMAGAIAIFGLSAQAQTNTVPPGGTPAPQAPQAPGGTPTPQAPGGTPTPQAPGGVPTPQAPGGVPSPQASHGTAEADPVKTPTVAPIPSGATTNGAGSTSTETNGIFRGTATNATPLNGSQTNSPPSK